MQAVTPHVNDVLFGRGPAINVHPGNRQFRSFVDSQKKNFINAKTKKQKRAIAAIVFNEIHNLQPPGRFLVEDHSLPPVSETRPDIVAAISSKVHHTLMKRTWTCVDPEKALDKILHRMRENDKAAGKGGVIQPKDDGILESHPQQLQIPLIAQPDINIGDTTSVKESNSQREQMVNYLATNHSLLEGINLDDIQNQPQGNPIAPVSPFHLSPLLQQAEINYSSTKYHEIYESNIRGGATTETKSKSCCMDFCNYLEGSSVDLTDSNPQTYVVSSQQFREYTFWQWIMSKVPQINSNTFSYTQSSTETTQYIKSALLIALKLTESILEAEKDEQNGRGNPISLASIAPENVLIWTRKSPRADGESNEADETIEFAWVMSVVGDDSATGTVMSRLFSMGKILYGLFAKNEFTMDEDDMPLSCHMVSMDSINISKAAENDYRSRKKKQWRWAHADAGISNCATRLESNGVPWSLCALVTNLLECRHDPFCEDDAYSSFVDLHLDLLLMVNNPSCFLDNINLSNTPKLVIPDKLYGRDQELMKLDDLFKRHISGKTLSGAILSGEAGVGKSTLAMSLQEITNRNNGCFLSAKFEQNQMSLKPLSTIATMFDSLCEIILNNSSHAKLMKIDEELMSALGSQPNLIAFLPNLIKLMPSCLKVETVARNCVDSAVSTRYLLGELLRIMASHWDLITIVMDDIQFADQASLLVVRYLLFSAREAPMFITLIHRDDESSMSASFNSWLTSISVFQLEPIKLESVTPRSINNLISEALHLSPRLTRPLSSVLYHKSRGNPLFLRQLLDSLAEQGYIYSDMKRHRWSWDLDKIIELEISESVLALFTKDIQRLPSELQFGLQVAACIGTCVTESMLNFLSIDLGLNLEDILQRTSQLGFMINIAGTTMFRFAHDKIQEAVYESMPDRQRRESHMRFGLALCTQTLENSVEDDELFFTAVNQINKGGLAAVHKSCQRSIFADLNLKAGRRSIELSDYNTAFELFQHGISFLGDGAWKSNYQLSLDLYDAISEAALTLNKLAMVSVYTDNAVVHARCFDDKLHCLCNASKALGVANRVDESIESSLSILNQIGEKLPQPLGDSKLEHDIDRMNHILKSTPDDTICNMHENNDKSMTTVFVLYAYLSHVAHYRRPWLVASLSLRMVELTIMSGLSALSPLAFALFGAVLSSKGFVNEGCRLGKLSLKLVARRRSLRYKSRVIYFVYNTIFWASEPLQMLTESHLLGHKIGQLSGDIHYSFSNLMVAMDTGYVAGQNIDTLQKDILDFISKLQIYDMKIFFNYPLLLLSQLMVLRQGLHMSSVAHVDTMPSEEEILINSTTRLSVNAHGKLYHLTRAFLFRQLGDSSLNVDVSGLIAKSNHQLDPTFLFGYFFEGLASFLLARKSSDIAEAANWTERGKSVLRKMQCWSEHSLWNWENKMLLLNAESEFTNGEFDRAGFLYDCAIRSAREHKFVHEEAIASELAGAFYYERGLHQKSFSCLVHSVECYEMWGAFAVARRVQNDINGYFGDDIDQYEPGADNRLESLLASIKGSEKKRQHGE